MAEGDSRIVQIVGQGEMYREDKLAFGQAENPHINSLRPDHLDIRQERGVRNQLYFTSLKAHLNPLLDQSDAGQVLNLHC